ncbi:hypothetical protein GGR51DRAFT_43653 [Nemania sp. FL0031]|nr:hypothetical protein GGR51DRAFT_43653 [Nemania sp. FL0031]
MLHCKALRTSYLICLCRIWLTIQPPTFIVCLETSFALLAPALKTPTGVELLFVSFFPVGHLPTVLFPHHGCSPEFGTFFEPYMYKMMVALSSNCFIWTGNAYATISHIAYTLWECVFT